MLLKLLIAIASQTVPNSKQDSIPKNRRSFDFITNPCSESSFLKKMKPLSAADLEMPSPGKVLIDLNSKNQSTQLRDQFSSLSAKLLNFEDQLRGLHEKDSEKAKVLLE